jgi:RNA polymerase sigma-70 factor (ECF subfamily)
LLDRLRAAPNGSAWARLVALYAPTVEEWCRRAGLSPEDAADVAQEVFGTVIRVITEFRRERPGDSFRGWLYTITSRRLIDFRRRDGRQPRAAGGTDAQDRLGQLPAAEAPESVGPEGARAGYERFVQLVRDEFEGRTWDAFWRVTVDGRPASVVATELGMTPGAVYIAKSRVLKRLRQVFPQPARFVASEGNA